MPRLTQDQWARVRADREAGASFRDLSRKYGVSISTIHKRARTESWGDGSNVIAEIRRRAAEKANAVPNTVSPQKKAEAIDEAAGRVVEIIKRQRRDWETHREKFGEVPENFEAGKEAKIAAEMLRIRHQGERMAWGLEDANPAPQITITRAW